MKYKVLWMEDEADKMDAFFDLAYNNDIELIQVSTFVDFKMTIEKNSRFYFDAIILDALGLMDTTDETPSLRALNEAINFINQHKAIEVIPYIILSGYLGNVEFASVTEMLGTENIYYKSKDEKKLLADIKESMKSKLDAQLKYKYRDLLEVCSDNFLGSSHFTRLYLLIKHIENVERLSNTEDMLNPVRKIMERVFTRMSEIGIIPESIINNIGWINKSSQFLSNKHPDFDLQSDIIPPVIAENVFRLLNIIQDASHSEGTLKLRVDEYLKSVQSDFFYRSSLFLLFDILMWFKDFTDNHKDVSENKKLWLQKSDSVNRCEWISGEIIRIAENGYGTFKPFNGGNTLSIVPYKIKEYNLIVNQQIEVITKVEGEKTLIQEIQI